MVSEQDLKTFVKDNRMIGYAVSVIFALTLKDLISSFIGDVLVPGFNLFLLGLKMKQLSRFLPGKQTIDLQPFVKSILTFVLTFMIVFFSITMGFESWMDKPNRDKSDKNKLVI